MKFTQIKIKPKQSGRRYKKIVYFLELLWFPKDSTKAEDDPALLSEPLKIAFADANPLTIQPSDNAFARWLRYDPENPDSNTDVENIDISSDHKEQNAVNEMNGFR
ncbi:uncharacterized protein ASCRUDRAFT_7351 [Ascoidea rubescens DSM 1968]|uniref:Uncharacterized protein n=1 Tax=Ascoidea rubescens DSM 1968 TaxID=1344418 RepID=A0A1D2VJV8_9ASCO|nr:hypothetical protein ASCRUDRAFT_7351 [Ascoidea rubescens DSM 1968]ODV61883.1 hypothetical protein ASCRUDRAFT_7351 [Ascoidea rubescens DSM 1968]